MPKQDQTDLQDSTIPANRTIKKPTEMENAAVPRLDSHRIKTSLIPKLTIPRNSQRICVCARKRPIDDSIDSIGISDASLVVQNSKLSYNLQGVQSSHRFVFDYVFDKNATNSDIFHACVKEIVDHSISGGCGSIIAYGQTGTGKTYTILEPYTGVVFESIQYALKNGKQGSIAFCEIYMGQVYDCLNGRMKLNLFESNNLIYASEIYQKSFKCFEDVKKIFEEGMLNRTTSATSSNACSSRSHAVIFVEFTDHLKNSGLVKSKKLASENSFVLIDLAGSERGSDRRSSSKISSIEGAEINKSLLALKECIRGIDLGNKFLPFRQSKLTQVLKNSLIGNSKACVIATVSANHNDIEHTLNTLRYAYRIKEGRSYSNTSENQIYGNYDSDTASFEVHHKSTPVTEVGASLPRLQSCIVSDLPIINENIENFDQSRVVIQHDTNILSKGSVGPEPNQFTELFYSELFESDVSSAKNDSGSYETKNSNKPSNLHENGHGSIFEGHIASEHSIKASTVKFQKMKINEILNGIITSVDDNNNLQTLKKAFLGLKDLDELLKKG